MDPDDSVPIDDDHRIKSAKRSVTSIAKNRWKILANALCQCQSKIIVADETPVKESMSDDYMASVRRFTCFNLFQRIPLNDHVHWLTIRTNINDVDYSIVVHEIHQKFTPKDLIGFNNTGNVCVWPSEESLAYFALDNLQMFEHQRILELGGGMTCLVGLFIAKYANANFVHLTDGNGKRLSCKTKPIDFQLPTQAYERDYTPAVTTAYEPPPPREFKEKTVKSLDEDSGSVPNTFKKRKFGGNKRNARQRLDDDD